MTPTIALADAAALIWQEADILDRQDYDNWLPLWSHDALYVVPIDQRTQDFANHLNYIYDDAKMRSLRVERLKSRYSVSALAAASTVRTVSRFTVTGQRDDELDLRAAQILVEYRRDRIRTVAANLEVTVRRTDSMLKLARKVVWLANSEDAVAGIGYLL